MTGAARPLSRLAVAALCSVSLQAQAFALQDLDGRAHTLASYGGKWVVVNVWATWCAPCIREMPELEALAKARPDVVVLGLAADGTPRRLRQFSRALGVTYPVIAGSKETLASFKVTAFPTTLVYGPTGELVMTKLGQVSRRDIERYLPPR